MGHFRNFLRVTLCGGTALAGAPASGVACTPDPATVRAGDTLVCRDNTNQSLIVTAPDVHVVIPGGATAGWDTVDMNSGTLQIDEGASVSVRLLIQTDPTRSWRVENRGTLKIGEAYGMSGVGQVTLYNAASGHITTDLPNTPYLPLVLLPTAATVINEGRISGQLVLFDGSTLINSGRIHFVAMVGSDNTMEIRPGTFLGSVQAATPSDTNNTFRLGGRGEDQFHLNIGVDSWATRLEKTGSSTWSLAGFASQPMTVYEGTLAGDASVGDLRVEGGTLSPGYAGHFYVGHSNFTSTGTAILGPAATLRIELHGASSPSLIANAVQLGGTLQIVPIDVQADTYTVVQSPSITGNFATVQVSGAVWSATTQQTGSAVQVVLTRRSLAPTSYSMAGAAAAALDNARIGASDAMVSLLNDLEALPARDQARAIASMTPERQAGTPTVMVGQTSLFQGALQNRVAQVGGRPAGAGAPIQLAFGGTLLDGLDGTLLHAGQSPWSDSADSGAWIAPWGGVARQKESGGASGWNASSGGIAVGVDTQVGKDVLAGAAFGWGRTSVTYGGPGGGSDNDSFLASLYGAWTPDDWTMDASLTGALSRFDTDRKVQAGTDLRTAVSDYSGRTVSAALGAKRHFRAGEIEIAPDARLTASRWWLDGYRERGANAADLEVDGRSGNRLRAETGVELAHAFATEEGRIRPWARLAVGHDWTSGNRALLARFAGTDAGFAVDGKDDAGLRWLPGLGVTLDISENLEASLEYQAELRPDFQAHTGQMALRYRF